MRFCAILILSVISILNSLELKSQTVVNILSNGYELERSLFLHGKKIGVYNKKGRLIKLSTDDKTRQNRTLFSFFEDLPLLWKNI